MGRAGAGRGAVRPSAGETRPVFKDPARGAQEVHVLTKLDHQALHSAHALTLAASVHDWDACASKLHVRRWYRLRDRQRVFWHTAARSLRCMSIAIHATWSTL